MVSSLFSSPFPSACREVIALFQTEHFFRLKNRSFSSDSGNLLFMCLADVVQYMDMLIRVSAHTCLYILEFPCRRHSCSCRSFHGRIYYWWHFGNIPKEYVILTAALWIVCFQCLVFVLSNYLWAYIYMNLMPSETNVYITLWTEPGDRVAVDEPIAQIETDKVTSAPPPPPTKFIDLVILKYKEESLLIFPINRWQLM